MDFVTFVILNWNKADSTVQAIENLEKVEHGNFGIIVVDNDSDNTEKEKLVRFFDKKQWPIVDEGETPKSRSNRLLILAKENYGYAKGNNIGLKVAKLMGYSWAVVMNNDVLLVEPVLETLLELASSDRKIGVIGPKVVCPNGKRQSLNFRPGIYSFLVYPLLFPILYPVNIARKTLLFRKTNRHGISYPYSIIGCFMLVNLYVMEEIGWFDEKTFLYSEEVILSERLLRAGYRVAYTEKVLIRHLHSAGVTVLNKNRAKNEISSFLYYFKEYRKYGRIRLSLVCFGYLYKLYFIAPLVRVLKSVLTILKSLFKG